VHGHHVRGLGRHREPVLQVHIPTDQVLDQGAHGVPARQRRLLHHRVHAGTTGDSTSANVSGVKGLAVRPNAPALSAWARMSSDPSEVTKQNGMALPDARSALRNSMPVISGMFQSDRIRSGDSLLTMDSASFPFSASTTS